jgi:hypothetical protein
VLIQINLLIDSLFLKIKNMATNFDVYNSILELQAKILTALQDPGLSQDRFDALWKNWERNNRGLEEQAKMIWGSDTST